MHVLLLSSLLFILFFLGILYRGRIAVFLHDFQSNECYAVYVANRMINLILDQGIQLFFHSQNMTLTCIYEPFFIRNLYESRRSLIGIVQLYYHCSKYLNDLFDFLHIFINLIALVCFFYHGTKLENVHQ